MMIIFGVAIQHFGDHYNTNNIFHCGEISNCSAMLYCSNVSDKSHCCLDDSFNCVIDASLLEQLDLVTLYCVIIGVVMFTSSWIHTSIFHYFGWQILEIERDCFAPLLTRI